MAKITKGELYAQAKKYCREHKGAFSIVEKEKHFLFKGLTNNDMEKIQKELNEEEKLIQTLAIKNAPEMLIKRKVDLLQLKHNYKNIKDMEQTEENCLSAVKRNWRAIEFIKTPSLAVVKEAISRDFNAFSLVKNQTPEICQLAVSSCGQLLEFVNNQTPELCMLAVNNSRNRLPYQTNSTNPLFYVKEKTPDICLNAIKKSPEAFKFIPKELQSPEILEALFSHANALHLVPDELKTSELCLKAVKSSGKNIRHVPPSLITDEICKIAINADHIDRYIHSLSFVTNQTPELCEMAIRACWKNIDYLKTPDASLELLAEEGRLQERKKEDDWRKTRAMEA